MSWLDNLIGFFNPEAAAKREAWRQVWEETRNHYDAAGYGRANANWYAFNTDAESTDRYARDTVRARARDLERNSDLVNSVIGPFVRNVVGGGLILQAETKNTKLNEDIERLWKIWCKKRNCDVTGTQSLNQMLRMAVRRKKIDGGVLFVKRYTRDGIIPFKLQMFEVDELDATQVLPHYKGNRVIGGIEYNQYNAPDGYWIRQYTLDGMGIADPVFLKADDVIFYFSKRRPSQLREMSDMSQTITRARDANEYMTAVSVKQRIEACFGLAIKKQFPTGGIGRTQAQTGPIQTYAGKQITPGMILEMNPGDDIQAINPQGQATDAAGFVKLLQRLIGAGQGISYEATSRDMSQTNYSSARQAIIEDSMTYAEEDELLADILDEIYETFIISAVLAGELAIKDFWDKKDDYFSHSFDKPPKPWIDPSKETVATKTALQTGQKTFKQIAAENGTDWRKQIDDICEVLQYAKDKHGVDLGGVILGQKKSDGLYEGEDEPDTADEAPPADAAGAVQPGTDNPAGEKPDAGSGAAEPPGDGAADSGEESGAGKE